MGPSVNVPRDELPDDHASEDAVGYELSARDKARMRKLSLAVRVLAILIMVRVVLALLDASVAGLMFWGAFVVSLVCNTLGVLFWSISAAFARVGTNRGDDIPHLMIALRRLRRGMLARVVLLVAGGGLSLLLSYAEVTALSRGP